MRGTLSYTKIPSLPFKVFGTWMKSWYNLWTIDLYIRYRCERLGYFKHIHLPRRCLPPNFFYSCPGLPVSIFWEWYIRYRILQNVSQWREASIICESSGEGNRSSAAAALRLRVHRHSSRFASSNTFALPFAHSPTAKPTRSSSGFQCRLISCFVVAISSSLPRFFSSS